MTYLELLVGIGPCPSRILGRSKIEFFWKRAVGSTVVFSNYFCRVSAMGGHTVRKGTREDVPRVFELINELATYERAPDAVTLTLDELYEDGFGPSPIYGLFVAEKDGTVVGIALYYEKYSTWTGRCIFLEDIIVTEQERGNGIGHSLFEAVMAVAKARNSARLEWQVLDWNEPAIRFYRKYNATLDPEWLNGKLTREQLQQL